MGSGTIFPVMLHPWRMKIGLALGGGAARGLAHLGVLRAFEREGIPVDMIAGTSMGAIIGGAFAATRDVGAVEAGVRRVLDSDDFKKNRLHFFRDARRVGGGLLRSMTLLVRRGIVYGMSTMRPSFLSAEELASSMHAILPDVPIGTLSLPFGAVALDLESGDEVVLRSGSLREACAASSAIPGVLPPRRVNGRLLIDGGWVDKVPVLPAYRMGADVVIAVDISADLEGSKAFTKGIEVILRANTIKDSVLVRHQRRLADVLIEPEVKHVHWADFEAVDACVRAGDVAATEAAPRIRELLRHERWRSVVRAPMGKRMAELYLDSPDVRIAIE